MKFTIQTVHQQTVNTKYGAKTKYRFTSGGQTYDAWAKKGFTDSFAPGYSFEAELSGKPFKGVDTISWPKQEQQSNNAQLDRIEQKVDFLIKILDPVKSTLPSLINKRIELDKSEIPYADSPHPEDKDNPYT